MKKNCLRFLIFILISLLITTIPPALYAQSLFNFQSTPESPSLETVEHETISQTLSQNSKFTTIESEIIADNHLSSSKEDESNLIYGTDKQGFPVILGGETLFEIKANFGPISARQRAEEISHKIEEIAKNPSISTDTFKIKSGKSALLIHTDELTILGILPDDAQAANLKQSTLANQYLKILKEKISNYREERSWKNILLGIIYALLATSIVIAIFISSTRIFPPLYSFIKLWCEGRGIPGIQFQGLELVSANQIISLLIGIAKLIRLVLVLIILNIYIPLLLSFFPWTKPLSKTVMSTLIGILAGIFNKVWQGFLDYLPNIFLIIVIVLITYYLLGFLKLIFSSIAQERIALPGFDPEWSEPTHKIVMFLIIIFAVAIIFPYLPGSDSPAFQGLSLLVGALFTLGSSGAISNLVSGLILIYTKAFRVGDRIKVDDIIGKVIEKTILSTRILTSNNVTITVPNASLLASNISNYNTAIREHQKPLILHTTVTLSYDVPWRKVHETLISAAYLTPNILQNPEPCVWQTSLNDFYVSYELRAYTQNIDKIGPTYSELHQNIQDKCKEAGIELLSPHYSLGDSE